MNFQILYNLYVLSPMLYFLCIYFVLSFIGYAQDGISKTSVMKNSCIKTQ